MKRILRTAAFFCIMLTGLMLCPNEARAEDGRNVIRVGYPIQEGLTYKDENGNYCGYTVDYLNELSKYTDWEYEYVEVEGNINTQLSTLITMLQDGEIDMMGAMNYSEALEEYFLYPSYNYGTSYTSIAVRKDNQQWLEEDYQNWDGIRVAMYPNMERRMGLLEKFAEVNGFTYETVEFDTAEEMLEAVRNGEADAVLQVDISMEKEFRSIAKFNPTPYYFAVNKDRPDILRDLNAALYSLSVYYSSFQSELYQKYFSYSSQYFISQEDRGYLESLGPMRVLFFRGNMPVQDQGADAAAGIAADFFRQFSENSGMEFTPVYANDYLDGLEMIKNGEVDLVAAMPSNVLLSSEVRLRLSAPYFESFSIAAYNKTRGSTGTLDSQWLSVNTRDRMAQLRKNDGKSAFLDAHCVNFYSRKKALYEDINFDWSSTSTLRYSVGLVDGSKERLIELLNHYINSLSHEERQELLYKNAHVPMKYTLSEFWVVYYQYIVVLALILVAAILFYRSYRRNHELKRSAMESERFHQFSMLTNECLFDYDFKNDRMNVQNSQLFFAEKPVLSDFCKTLSEKDGEGSETEKLQHILYRMLENREGERNTSFYVKGEEIWIRIQIKYIGENREAAIGRISNITQEIQMKLDLEREANTDALTGLQNRLAAERYISHFLEKSGNRGILILLDIDNFKQVNDTLGHVVGDRMLQEFANELSGFFRGGDLKARLGGDEFIIFVEGWMQESLLSTKLRQMRDRLNDKVFSNYPQCDSSVSIGAAYSGGKAVNYNILYSMADHAMYVAKYAGKNDFFIATEEYCMKKNCSYCKKECKKRDYLQSKGALENENQTAATNA